MKEKLGALDSEQKLLLSQIIKHCERLKEIAEEIERNKAEKP